MPFPVCTIGHRFHGVCHACGNSEVDGMMITGSPVRHIDGLEICVTGSIGIGDCGHLCYSVGQSTVFFIDGLPVVRIGDPVTGDIDGKLITGSDYVRAD